MGINIMDPRKLSHFNVFLLVIVLSLLLLLIYLLHKMKFISDYVSLNQFDKITDEKVIIQESSIPEAGRGVFAKQDIKKDEIISVCPFIVEDNSEKIEESIISDYVFINIDDENKRSIVLGNCSMYNHKEDYNVSYYQSTKPHNNMIFFAERDIKKGEELFISYGTDYWSSRDIENN